MASYVVMRPGSGDERHERTAFIRDGFSVIAFLVPLIWLLWHRLWAETVLLLAVGVLIGAAGEFALLPEAAIVLLSLLANLLVGLEGQGRRIARLRRKGLSEDAVIWASSIEDAEERYFGEGSSAGNHRTTRRFSGREGASATALARSGDHGLVGMVSHRGVH